MKLKGIDGGPHKQWSMWFNSTQREEPYQGLTYTGIYKRLYSISVCKALSAGKKMTVPAEAAPANYVPAAAVIRRGQALSGFTGCKGSVDGFASQM